MRFFPDVLEEMIEEADFLYCQRRLMLERGGGDLNALRSFEERLLAHLEALETAGSDGDPLLLEALKAEDPGPPFVAGAVLLRRERCEVDPALIELAEKASTEGFRPLADSFWFLRGGERDLEDLFGSCLASQNGGRRALGVLGMLRAVNRRGVSLKQYAEDEDSRVRWALCIGMRAQPGERGEFFRDLWKDKDASVRAASLEASARLGHSGVLDELRALTAGGCAGESELVLLGRIGDDQDAELLAGQAGEGGSSDAISLALSGLGTIEAARKLLWLWETPAAAVAAAEGFARITGFRAGLVGSLAEDEDDALPDLEEAQSYLATNEGKYATGGRFRNGDPLRPDDWLENPYHGDLLTRKEEITRLRSRGAASLVHIDLEAPAEEQLAQ